MKKTEFAKNAYRYFAVWGVCSALVTTVCTLADGLLIGNIVGSDGLAVSNLSTPVFLLYALLGVTVGVGANVLTGRHLGAGKVAEANRVFAVQLTVGLLLGLLCMLPLLFREPYFRFLGVTDALYPLAEQYLTVVMWSAPLFVMYHILSASVRTDSDPRLAAAASAVVIVTDVALDLLFMKGLRWGILGASASLCIAECLGICVLLTHFVKKRRLLKLKLAFPKPSELRDILANGFGVGSAQIFGTVVMLVFNTLLIRADSVNGAVYVAVYGVLYTVSTIPMGFFEGASTALSTVTAYFTGESDTESVFDALKRAFRLAAVSGGILAVLCCSFPGTVFAAFGITGETASAYAPAIQIFALGTVFSGLNTVATAFWQSVGRAKLAGIFSCVRNCLLLLALGMLLIPSWNIFGLSIACTLAEGLCTAAVLGVRFVAPSRRHVAQTYGPKGRVFESSYSIRAESMERISADLEDVCDRWEIGMKQSFTVSFICEEVLLNIIKFGMADTKKQYTVSLKLMELGDGAYVLRIRDNVNSYNPFESSGDEIDSGVLRLIQKKTKFCEYQRKMIFNYLYLVI